MINRPAIGFERIDITAAAESGSVVTHVPEYCTDEASDHATARLLAMHRRVPWFDNAIGAGR